MSFIENIILFIICILFLTFGIGSALKYYKENRNFDCGFYIAVSIAWTILLTEVMINT